MIICSTNVLWMVLILLKQRVGFYKMQNGFFKINFFMLIIYILLKKETLRGHPFSTYTIFCKKMTPPPHPPWYTRTFCNTPSHCVRTNLLYPPPPLLLFCQIEFFVQTFIRFRDAAYYIPKDYTLFNFFSALLVFTTKQYFLNKHGHESSKVKINFVELLLEIIFSRSKCIKYLQKTSPKYSL